MLKIAFAGFRHGHIFGMYSACTEENGFKIVAACEEHGETRDDLEKTKKAAVTHDSFEKMLDEVDCDVIACGDYYGTRGSILIEALKRGKHVIADKPVCTSMAELDEIEKLAGEKGLKVGCMLDARNSGHVLKLRELIRGGVIGEVHAINIGGQHPLLYGTRPSWYFEEGKHGGTINDIAIHAVDFVPWITGLEFAELTAARSWNARLPEVPYFHDAGQFLAKMSNNCGFFCDVSYFMPDSFGYGLELYWRMTFFGKDGILETSMTMPNIMLAKNGNKEKEMLDPCERFTNGYLKAFANDIKGEKTEMATADVIKASRISLKIQQAAFENKSFVELP